MPGRIRPRLTQHLRNPKPFSNHRPLAAPKPTDYVLYFPWKDNSCAPDSVCFALYAAFSERKIREILVDNVRHMVYDAQRTIRWLLEDLPLPGSPKTIQLLKQLKESAEKIRKKFWTPGDPDWNGRKYCQEDHYAIPLDVFRCLTGARSEKFDNWNESTRAIFGTTFLDVELCEDHKARGMQCGKHGSVSYRTNPPKKGDS